MQIQCGETKIHLPDPIWKVKRSPLCGGKTLAISDSCDSDYAVTEELWAIPRDGSMKEEQISDLSNGLRQIESSWVGTLASMLALVRYVVERIDSCCKVADQEELKLQG